tara:strand:+ start:2811 stop:3707 length:897 start_codon:yes stop_codon:yes gene_type:complete
MIHHDPNLARMIGIEDHDPDKIIVNPRFSEWEWFVAENNEKAFAMNDDRDYQKGEAKKFREQCQEHRRYHKKPVLSETVFLLTHPFFTQIKSMCTLDKGTRRKDATDVVQKTLSILLHGYDPEKVSFVATDSPDHYAVFSSILLERGLLRDVILTNFNNSEALEESEFDFYKDKTIYCAGGYNGAMSCLGGTFFQILKSKPELKKVFAIKDLILNSPQNGEDTLVPQEIEYLLDGKTTSIAEERIISSQKSLESIGLEPYENRYETPAQPDPPVKRVSFLGSIRNIVWPTAPKPYQSP